MSPPENNTSSVTGGFLDLATLLALATAAVYAAGWTYAYHYFAHFQLGLLTLAIPAEYYFMYGFWVFRAWWVLGFLYVALVLPLFWLLSAGPRRVAMGRYLWLARGLFPILLLLLFLGVHQLGVYTAKSHYARQQASDFSAYPRVRVWLKPQDGSNAMLNSLAEALPQGCHRSLLQNQDKIFLFLPPAAQTPARLAAVAVPLGEIVALRVLPQYGSC